MRKKSGSNGKPDKAVGVAGNGGDLFERVASIVEQARTSVLRSINSKMVLAYWLLGREIVEELQGGKRTASYGRQFLGTLSEQLTTRFGEGFSVANLQNYRSFFLAYPVPFSIQYPAGSKSASAGTTRRIEYPSGSELPGFPAHASADMLLGQGFSAELPWSDYRALFRVKDANARHFYETEAIESAWNKSQLEREIGSSHYRGILAHRGKAGLTSANHMVLVSGTWFQFRVSRYGTFTYRIGYV